MIPKRSPFELMNQKAHYNEVLNSVILFSEQELAQLVQGLHEEELVELAVYTSTTCRRLAAQQTVVKGCLFYLFGLAVDADGRQEFLDNLCHDLSTSRTQAYRCRAVWCKMGSVFSKEPHLAMQFVPEALKLLAAEEVPDPAREEALQRVREGERISIKTAKALIRSHGGQLDRDTDSESTHATRTRRSWLFSGKLLRIQLLPSRQKTSVELLIEELQSAIRSLREQPPSDPRMA